ncbi:MAG: DEAD/DEAH box helicase family protein, partial [Lachnospiraceae bacterium]|nr:DEAD/DEAH box helicase family protein [Lachnospiraceae bacterium]
DLYGDCMEKVYGYRPVLYYTNGYETKVIDGIYPDRTVMAFHTLQELESIIRKRERKNITNIEINDEITNRPYQKMAITNICEWLNAKHRRGLLVMATGTGKTRVAISLVDVLLKNNWISNVLFLADRTTLVNQAKRNFEKYFTGHTICELSGDAEKDYNARMMFCTYQSMINYIDAEDKRFMSGRFDLIIIDEAHRSIFNRYGSIFKYFDSFLIGLTATPKDEVDANTYRIFGCEAGIPNFDYKLEDAIKEKYLVGYRVINKSSKLMREGIKYSDLSESEKEQLEDYFIDGSDEKTDIDANKIFREVFNENTCKKVLEDLMSTGLRVNGGETIGKTIIFAYNHRHAQMIVDCFKELYPELPNNTCQLVDYSVNYAENLVIKFGEEEEFRIAVSVDMLDTGVDITSVLNLVFFKPVKSKIKFIQMIGRGTRLCENVFGPGKDKKEFLIFDYCGNFEYFDVHPEGAGIIPTITLSQRHFGIMMELLYELQSIEYQEHPWFKNYYEEIKESLHNDIVIIKNHGERIQVREAMRYVDKYYDIETWTAISPVTIAEVKRYLAPLIDSGLKGNYLSVSFDVIMYKIEKSILKNGNINSAANEVKKVRLIAQYLLKEKASVPQVLEKAEELKQLKDEHLWLNPDVKELERLRESVRELMVFLKDGNKKEIDIDIEDEITDSDYETEDTIIDIRTYREKVIDYLADHSDNEVVKKIYNLEPITNDDLDQLEEVLWKELGTKDDYYNTTSIGNLAAFIRSLIGLNQDAVNKKFGEYLSGNKLNSQQQE